jgi:hypothetical protein
VRRICRYFPVLVLLLFCVQFAGAQSFFDVGISFGAAQDKAASVGVDQGTLLNCALGSTTTCVPTPSLSAFMMGFNIDIILAKHLGAGFQTAIQPARQKFAVLQNRNLSTGTPEIDLQSRLSLYDIDAVYQPFTLKKAALQLKGGISIANLKFYENLSGANALIGSFSQSQYAGSSNHFGGHAGAGVLIFVTDHVFIRPAFDAHFIRNLTQFGSNFVANEMVTVGYSWGDR